MMEQALRSSSNNNNNSTVGGRPSTPSHSLSVPLPKHDLYRRNDPENDLSDEDDVDDHTSFSSTVSDQSEGALGYLVEAKAKYSSPTKTSSASLAYSSPFDFDSIAVPAMPSAPTSMLRSRANSSSSVVVITGNNASGSRTRTTSYTDIEMQQQTALSSPLAVMGSSFRHNQQRRNSLQRHQQYHAKSMVNVSGISSTSNSRIATPASTLRRSTTLTNRCIDWVQSHRVPAFLVRKYYTSSSLREVTAILHSNSNSTTDAEYDDDDAPAVVYWISGLDRVFGSTMTPTIATTNAVRSTSASQTSLGASSCADAVRLAGLQPPRYLWYMLSGALCDVVQLSTLATLYTLLDGLVYDRAALCWCLAFILSIPVRHVSHRYLVFGDYVGGYKQSLLRMYAGYSVTIVLSTIFNFIMARMFVNSTLLDLSILTMLWTGIANYFILRHFWKVGSPTASTSTSTNASSNNAASVATNTMHN